MTVAFLSYTRTDDEFHGGYITSFRKMLENAVHVVTGDKTFRVFQDVEGIVVGEQWQKKLKDVIHESSFFVPMITPLFLCSPPCRDEAMEFLAHEQSLGRDDLILPIYFFTSPKLEKAEERAKDPLVTELANRQLFDWRERAAIPLDQPAALQAMVGLAVEIRERLQDAPVMPPLPVPPAPQSRKPVSRGPVAPAPVSPPVLPVPVSREPVAVGAPGYSAIAEDPALAAGIAGNWKREAPQTRRALWVDDHADSNILERRALESYGMQFVLAAHTEAAQQAVRDEGPFSVIISDLGREGDSRAGLTLLQWLRDNGNTTSYFIYTTGRAAGLLGPVVRLWGGQGVTANPDEIVQMVVAATR
jgi:CheY-like chemotaxis protein